MQPNSPAPYAQPPMAPNPYADFMQSPTPAPSAPKKGPGLIIAFILTLLVLITLIGLFVWAYSGREDYKNNSDKKVAAAVEVAKKQESIAKEKEFAEASKSPLKSYQTPAVYGSINISYSKMWSAFITESATGNAQVDAYFHPNYVPGLQSGTAYALRVQVVDRSYAQEVKQFDGLIKSGKVKVSAYRPPKMPNISGSRVDGEIVKGQKDSMVLFPLRDKTIKISTQSADFLKDFDEVVLANLTFTP